MISNLVTGRQLRAGRVLAGLTQQGLADELQVNERAVRFWERKHDRPPTFSQNLRRIEEALQRRGVICFVKPTPGVRLAESANFDTSTRPRARPETGKFDE
jgi:transcriptional regulator with XRE-family HTH domain